MAVELLCKETISSEKINTVFLFLWYFCTPVVYQATPPGPAGGTECSPEDLSQERFEKVRMVRSAGAAVEN